MNKATTTVAKLQHINYPQNKLLPSFVVDSDELEPTVRINAGREKSLTGPGAEKRNVGGVAPPFPKGKKGPKGWFWGRLIGVLLEKCEIPSLIIRHHLTRRL
ncbi:hypothetical protein CEXT_433621 [Caerostris extrusa]|uniref:Uncharacterized protein n=1 Tax=Caerostris extrusa TaxID=172846 RepID=A0AAV4TNC0_CAEEX|nr:hypothetical protein CEXT_433621 [Caerostris extrusa]